jgi:hypothetical protein
VSCSAAIRMLLVALCLWSASAVGADVPVNNDKHLGVGSCSSNVCHGKPARDKDSNIGLNEYRIWSRDDYHSRAFRALADPQSKSIAAKLGIANAATSELCLGCHSDNVPVARRGDKYNQADGVSCEACHGGAERWIQNHKVKGTPHKDNLAAGMYPTDQPLRRAELCLSCHMGTRDKFATHAIMGAGHPRLRFELEVFTFNQPPHYVVDSYYEGRKGHIEKMNLWITGQVENARRYLELLQTRFTTADSLVPELALYDCFGCHHPLDKQRWSRSRAGAGIGPGTLRLQRYPFVMLQAITEVLAPGEAGSLTGATDQLVKAGQQDAGALRAQAQALHAWIDRHDDWTGRRYSPAQITQVRRNVLRYAAMDKGSDFSTAEQMVMCIDTLSYAANDHEARKAALESLYKAVGSASAFDPTQFADTAAKLQGQF